MKQYILAAINSSVGNVPYNINNIYLLSSNNYYVDLTIFYIFPCRKNILIKISESIIDLRQKYMDFKGSSHSSMAVLKIPKIISTYDDYNSKILTIKGLNLPYELKACSAGIINHDTNESIYDPNSCVTGITQNSTSATFNYQSLERSPDFAILDNNNNIINYLGADDIPHN